MQIFPPHLAMTMKRKRKMRMRIIKNIRLSRLLPHCLSYSSYRANYSPLVLHSFSLLWPALAGSKQQGVWSTFSSAHFPPLLLPSPPLLSFISLTPYDSLSILINYKCVISFMVPSSRVCNSICSLPFLTLSWRPAEIALRACSSFLTLWGWILWACRILEMGCDTWGLRWEYGWLN